MKKGDIALLIIAVIVLVIWLFPSQSGEIAKVYVDGKLWKTLPLSENSVTPIESDYGKNTVIIKDGEVYICDADCPDKLCEKSRIDKDGSSIVCLPNRLSVIIEDKKSNEKIDVVV